MGVFSRFLNCTDGIESHQASHIARLNITSHGVLHERNDDLIYITTDAFKIFNTTTGFNFYWIETH